MNKFQENTLLTKPLYLPGAGREREGGGRGRNEERKWKNMEGGGNMRKVENQRKGE